VARDPHQLREEAASAVARGKLELALELYGELEQLEPAAAAWPKRVGETYRRMGDTANAVVAFERAVDKYVHDGLLVQAIAVCKLILQIDPHHASTATRLSELATPTPAEARAVRKPAAMTTPAIEMARRAAVVAGDDKPARRVASDPRRDDPPASRAALLAAAARAPASHDSTAAPRAPESAAPAAPYADLLAAAARAVDPQVPHESPAVARVPSVRFAEPAALLDAAVRVSDSPIEPVTRSPDDEDSIPPITPSELAQRAAVRLPPGGGLDAIPLALVMPDSQRIVRADGTDAGMSLLRIDVAFDDVDDEVEIEIVDPHRMALLKTPVFAALPADALERLIGQLELRELYNGEELFHEGDRGATMFVISEGEVEVAAYGQELATLGPGAFFGEISLITDLPRSATIHAKGKVELLALDREIVRAAAVTSPEIVTALLSFVRERLVDRVSRTSPLFRPFSEEERAQLAARFEVIEVDAGAQLIKYGEKADGLYVVLAGKVDVTRDGDGSLATLSCGDVFGEMSLMGNRGSTANVHALTRVLALRLPAKVFQEIVVTYPQVLEFLGDLTSSRSRLRRAEEFLDLHITLV
jgi:CRP-like cAMP-binding protein